MKSIQTLEICIVLLASLPAFLFSQPAWVEKRPVNPLYYIGIGAAPKEQGSTDYLQKAKDNALNDLASQITVSVSSEIMRKVIETNATLEEEFKSQIQTSAKAELEGIEWVDTYDGDGQYWVYCRLSKEAYEHARQLRITSAMKLSTDLYLSGKRAEQENNISRALSYYAQALGPLEKYLGEPLEAEVGGRKVILVNEIYTSLQNRLSQIELKAAPPKQDAKVGTAVKRPFELSAVDQAKGTGIPGLPLKFAFLRGSGDMVDRVTTDNTGSARCEVNKVTATDRIQIIEARLAVDRLAAADGGSVMIQAVLGSLTVPITRFTLAVTGLEVYVEGEESLFGAKMQQPRLEPVIKSKLAEKGFAFTNDMANASVVISIKADSRQGSEQYGLYVSFVDVVVSVQDLRTGQEIYKNSANNLKGISNDYEKAAFRAYDEAATKIANELLPKLIDKIQK